MEQTKNPKDMAKDNNPFDELLDQLHESNVNLVKKVIREHFEMAQESKNEQAVIAIKQISEAVKLLF